MKMRLAVISVVVAAAIAAAVAGCGASSPASRPTVVIVRSSSAPTSATATAPKPPPKPQPPAYPELLPAATATRPTGFVPAVRWLGRNAAWIARTASGMALMSFDQRLVGLRLHSGTVDAGSSGWRFGPAVIGSERGRLVAAFNGGFRLSVGAGGFESGGRVAAQLHAGLGSIVTYADGTTDIGTWDHEVPFAGKKVISVRQNLPPLIDRGQPASTLDCLSCWGATLGGVANPARASLGITDDGHLIWAAGEHVTTRDLASALLRARVVRAVELDINPEWVAGYLYRHHGAGGNPQPVPALGDQQGIPGQFLAPWQRDFFTIVAR